MATLNKVILMGNLTRDPELRRVGNNSAVCNMGLAVNRRYTTASGENREETCFVDIEVWERQAENCQQYLRKGSLILVEGRLRQDRWEDKETGAARSKLMVRGDNVQFLSTDSSRSSGSGGDEEGSRSTRSEGSWNNNRQQRASVPAAQASDQMGDSVQEEDDIPF